MHLRKIQRNTVTKVILASEVKPGLSNVQLRVPFRALSLTLFFLFHLTHPEPTGEGML